MDKQNKIIWLTGQSGAGKTTLAKELRKHIPSIILDGDEMRRSISTDLGFSLKDREINNSRIMMLAYVLSFQTNVIISVIAPTKRIREVIDFYLTPTWIYVKRNLPEREGHIYEEPLDYFTVDTDKLNVNECVSEILSYIDK